MMYLETHVTLDIFVKIHLLVSIAASLYRVHNSVDGGKSRNQKQKIYIGMLVNFCS
jgi:hypothetical protein